MNIPIAALQELGKTTAQGSTPTSAGQDTDVIDVDLSDLKDILPPTQRSGGSSAFQLPKVTDQRLADLDREAELSAPAFEGIDTTTDEGLQQAFDAYRDTPLGKRSAREGETKALRADLSRARKGELLTPDEWLEKTAVGVNLKAKSGLEGLSNTSWRLAEIASMAGLTAATRMNSAEGMKMAAGIMEVANRTANYASRQKSMADQEFENIQPDTVQRALGTATEQIVQNAPSMITAMPARAGANAVVRAVMAFNESRQAANVARLGSAALTQVNKLTNYEKIATATALGASAGVSGIMEGVPTYDRVYLQMIDKGYSEADAKSMASLQAFADGGAAAVLTAAFGTGAHGGIESVYGAKGREGLRGAFFRWWKQAFGEGAEEGMHGTWSGILDMAMANPDRSLQSVMQEGIANFAGGAIFGGGVAVVTDVHREVFEVPAEQKRKEDARIRRDILGDTQITFSGREEVPNTERPRTFRDPGEDAELLRPIAQSEYNAYKDAVLSQMPPEERVSFEATLNQERSKGQRGPASTWLANRIRLVGSRVQTDEAKQAEAMRASDPELNLGPQNAIPKARTNQGTLVAQTDEQIRQQAVDEVRKFIPTDQLQAIDLAISKRDSGRQLDDNDANQISGYEGRINWWVGEYKRQEQEVLDRMDVNAMDIVADDPAAIGERASIMAPGRSYTHAAKKIGANHANPVGMQQMAQLKAKYDGMLAQAQARPDFEEWASVPENQNLFQAWSSKSQFYAEALERSVEIRDRARLQNVQALPEVDTDSIPLKTQQNIQALYDPVATNEQKVKEIINDITQGYSPSEIATRFGVTPNQVRAVRVIQGLKGYDVRNQFDEWIYQMGQAAPTAAAPAPAPAKKKANIRFNKYWDFGNGIVKEMWTIVEDIPNHPAGSDLMREALEQEGYDVPPAPPRDQPKKGAAKVKVEAPQEITNDHKIKILEWMLAPARKERVSSEAIRKTLGFPGNASSAQPIQTVMAWLANEAGLQKGEGRFGAWTFSPERAAEALVALKGGGINPAPIAAASALVTLQDEVAKLTAEGYEVQIQAEMTDGEDKLDLQRRYATIQASIEEKLARIKQLQAGDISGTDLPPKMTQDNAPVVDVNLKGIKKNRPTIVSVGGQKFQIKWTSKRAGKGFTTFYEIKQEDGNWTPIAKNREEAIDYLKKLVAPPAADQTPKAPDPEAAQEMDPTKFAQDNMTIEDIRKAMQSRIGSGGFVRTMISVGFIGAAIFDILNGDFDGGMQKAAAAGIDPHTARVVGAVVEAVSQMVKYGYRRFVDIADKMIQHMTPIVRPYLLDAYRIVRDNSPEGAEMDNDAELYRAVGGEQLALNPSEAPGSYVAEDRTSPQRRRFTLSSKSMQGRFAVPLIKKAIAPTPDLESEPGYVYHVVNDEEALDIAETALMKPVLPYGRTEGKRVWQDDGSSDRRRYWTNAASSLVNHIPPDGKPVVFRVKLDIPTVQGTSDFEVSNHGDVFTRKAIPTEKIEILTSSGWKQLWNGSKVQVTLTEKKESRAWPMPNRTPGIGQWSTETVDVGMKKLAPLRALRRKEYDIGTVYGTGDTPQLVTVKRRRVRHQSGYDPVPLSPTDVGTLFSFDSKGNLQQDFNSLPEDAKEAVLTIMRSRATPTLDLEQWMGMSPSAMRKFAADNSYGNEIDLAIAMGRNVIQDDGALHQLITQYRQDRLAELRYQKSISREGQQKHADASERIRIWSAAMQAATATGQVAQEVLVHDPTWLPGIQMEFNWVQFLREDRQALEQLVQAKGPDQSIIFLRQPKVMPTKAQPIGGAFKPSESERSGATAKEFEGLKTTSLEWAVVHSANEKELQANLKAVMPGGVNAHEQAYLDKMWELMSPRIERIVTNDVRNQSLEAAKAAGYKPQTARPTGVDELKGRQDYPRLINAPAASPVGDHLYRTTKRLRNGIRTVAVETFRMTTEVESAATQEQRALILQQQAQDPDFKVSDLWPALQTQLKIITPAQAAKQDHVVATVNGKYVGFYGWKDTVKPEMVSGWYSLVDKWPAEEYNAIPIVKYRPRIIRRGGLGPRDTYFTYDFPTTQEEFAENYDVPNLSEGQIRGMFSFMEELEAEPQAQRLFRSFLFDVFGGGIASSTWFNPRPTSMTDEVLNAGLPGKGPIVHEMNESKFSRTLMSLMDSAVMSEERVDRANNQTYVTVQIPGLTGQIVVHTDPRMTKEAIYNAFISELTDGMTVRLAQIVVRDKMRLPLVKTTLETFRRRKLKNFIPKVGDKVLVRHYDTWTEAVVKRAYNQPFFSYDAKIEGYVGTGEEAMPVVKQNATGVKGERMVYDVEIPTVQEELIGGARRNVYITALTLAEMRDAVEEEDVSAQQVLRKVEFGRRFGARPEMFDGQPLTAQGFMGRPDMRSLYIEAGIASNRELLIRHWAERLSNDQLISAYLSIGGDPESARRFSEQVSQEILKKTIDTYQTANRASLRGMSTAERQRAAEQAAATHSKRERSLLASKILDQFRFIYAPLMALEAANRRAKAFSSKTLLSAVPEGLRVPQTIRPLYDRVKQAQANPPSQNQRLQGLEEKYLPPRERTGGMTWRLVDKELIGNLKGLPEGEAQKEALSIMPMGQILLTTEQSGSFYTRGLTLETDSDGNPIDRKSIEARPVSAFLSVSKGEHKAYISVIDLKHPSGYRPIYSIDLDLLEKRGGAKPFTHSIVIGQKEVGGEMVDETKDVTGWYFNPKAVANSTLGIRGIGLWSKVDHENRKWISIEEYLQYIQEILQDPSTIQQTQVVDKDGTPAVMPAQHTLPTGIADLVEELNTRASSGDLGAAAVMTLMNTSPINDTRFWGWRDDPGQVMSMLMDVFMEGWQKLPDSDPKKAVMWETLEDKVQSFMHARFAEGFIANVSSAPPTSNDVDPRLIGKEFTGRQQITEFLNSPGNGFFQEQKDAALALLRFLPDVIVDSFAMTMVLGPEIGGRGQRVFYGGAFSHLLRLARVVAAGGDTNAVAEEIAHAAAKFLPKVMADNVERLRQTEIERLNQSEQQTESARDFISWLAIRGGQTTSQEFVAANRGDWVPFYWMINSDEYFAHALTEAAIRAETSVDMGKIRQFFYGIWRRMVQAIKNWTNDFGFQRDTFFDDLINRFVSGNFDVSMNGGFLAEVNSHSDIASVAVVTRPAQLIRKAQEEGWRGTGVAPGQSPETLAQIAGGSYATVYSAMTDIMDAFKRDNNELSPRAKALALVTNVEGMLQVTREIMPTLTLQGYDLTKTTLPTEALREQFKLAASAAYHDIERQQANIEHKWQAQSEYMKSEPFLNLKQITAEKAARIYPFETMIVSVEAQIESAIKALQQVSVARGASQEKYTRAQEDLRWLNRIRSFAPGVAQRIQTVVNDLATIPEGFALLESGIVLDPVIVERTWLATNPPAEAIPQESNIDRDPAWAMQRVAFMMIAKYIRLRGQFAAASYSKEEAVLAALPGFAAALVSKLSQERNATAIARMVRMNARNFTNLEKAKRIVLEMERKIAFEANKMEAYDQARDFMTSLVNHPTYVTLTNQIRKDVGEKYVPRAWAQYGLPQLSEEIVVPVPGQKTADGKQRSITITIPNDENEWKRGVAQIQEAMMAIQGYTSNLGENSPERAYFDDWYQFLDMLQYSTQLHHNGWNNFFGFKWMLSLVGVMTQHIESILVLYPGRITNMLRAPLRAWSDSSALMNGKWKPKYVHRIGLGLTAAVRSHPEIHQPRGKANLAAKEWREMVGRELGTFLSSGYAFKAGDALPVTGVRVTQEDLNFFKLQTEAIDEAMSYNVVRDRGQWIPEPVREDKWVPGYEYLRRNIKTQPGLLTRRWNHEALDFTGYYVRLLKQGRRAEAMQYLDANLMGPVLWFLSHRQAGWALSSFGAETVYAETAEALRQGNLKTMADVLGFMDANFGLTSEVPGVLMSEQFMKEFDTLQQRIFNDAISTGVSSDTGITVKATSTENSFTLGSVDAMAPGWWYNWGITDTSDAMNFALSGSTQYYNEFKRMLQSVIETLSRNQEQVTAAASYIAASDRQKGKNTTVSQAQLRMKSGKRTIKVGDDLYAGDLRPQDIQELIRTLEHLRDELDVVFRPHQRFSTTELKMVMRVAGTMTGSILASVSNTMRNLVSGAFGYNAFAQKIMGRSLLRAVPVEMTKTLFKVAWGVALLGPAAMVHFAKSTEWKSVARNAAHILGKQSQGKWRPLEHILKLEADFAPMFQGAIDSIVWKGRTIKDLEALGLGMELDLRGMLYQYAEVLSQGGILNVEETERSTHPFRQMGRVIYGLADFHVLGLSKLLPRPGDMTANISVFNSTIGSVENIERQLRKSFTARRRLAESGLIASATSIRGYTADEVVPGFIRTPTGRQTVYNEIATWFNSAGIDLNRSINDFYATLEATPMEERKKVRWLTEPQMFALAQEMVEAVNVASPKNRPILGSKGPLMRMALLLMGWNVNMFSKLSQWMGAAEKEGNAGGRFLTKTAVVSMAAVIFALNEMGLEEILRQLMWLYDKEARPARQPWEVSGLGSVAKEVMIDISASVPVLAHVVQAAFNSQGGRLGQGLTTPVQNWTLQGINYVSGVWNTQDPTYGLDRLMRSWVPLSRVVLNRIPALSGSVEAMNARRLLARNADEDLLRERSSPGFGGRMATVLTPYADKMVNAAMHEDYEELAALFDEAVKIQMQDPAVDSYDEAVKRVRQLYSSRNAYARAFKQRPTQAQRMQILGNMSDRDRNLVQEYERKFATGGRRIGVNVNYTDQDTQIRYDRGGIRTLRSIRGHRAMARRSIMRGRTRNPLTTRLRRL